MSAFKVKLVRQLQEYLMERGVVFANTRKQDLVRLCELASEVNIEVDPDGLIEDRDEVLVDKLTVDSGAKLTNPQLLTSSPDLSAIPQLSIFDIYNYLVTFTTEYSHSALREYHKLEGYTMFKDGYVMNVESATYDPYDYVAVKANVKPRTSDKDPVTKQKYYRCWIIMKKNEVNIHSAYCTCKGGIDGCCRHVVAVLFELLDYMNDHEKTSCTSKPCTWKRRASEADKLSKPIPAADLDTSVLNSASLLSPKPKYCPLPEEVQKPDVNAFLDNLKILCPKACVLRSKFDCTSRDNSSAKQLTVATPLQKLEAFNKEHTCIIDSCVCANIFLHYHLVYTPEQCTEIEELTRGQCSNNNWYAMRKGLLTASLFYQVNCSTDIQRTAVSLLKPGLNEDNLPSAVSFGRMYKSKARNIFFKSHRFRHRQCCMEVPGLVLYQDSACPVLACSPDGIVNCKICGQFLIEIKCSFKYKCFCPKNALKLSNICKVDENDNVVINKSHKYYYQIQGQMGVTGIHRSVLVFYTHKGITTVDIDFDREFWISFQAKALAFYRDAYFTQLRQSLLESR